MENLIANDPITAAIQQDALTAFQTADKAEGLKRKSRLSLVHVLCHAWEAPVEAVHRNPKGETVFSHAFTIGDYCQPDYVKNAAGDNAQAQGAMTKAVVQRLSGLADPTPAHKAALNDARKVAFHLMELCDGDASLVGKTSRGNVTVPGYVMLKEPDAEKAPESEIERYQKEKDQPFTLDGSKGRSFNELRTRVTPKASREGDSGQGGGEAKQLNRVEAAKALLSGAANGLEWAAYLADLSPVELVDMLSAWSEKDAAND